MIELKNLSFNYGEKNVLKDLNLSIHPQTFHSIIGLSGAGKTLLLKILSGLRAVQTGSIENLPQDISFIFQHPNFFSWLSILKNLEICTKASRVEILRLLNEFRLGSFANMYPAQLSGGTLQKVNILRGFLNKPDLILMDEPFVHLDMVHKEELYDFTLKLWNNYKTTILLVTHDVDEALYLSGSISYLSINEKKIKDFFDIKLDRKLSFSESKRNKEHLEYFDRIYANLKADFGK